MVIPLQCIAIAIAMHESLQQNSFTYRAMKVKSSNHMEHMGLVRALQFLADNSLHVMTLVTDRHNPPNCQIATWLK